jgi:hypothetical protein
MVAEDSGLTIVLTSRPEASQILTVPSLPVEASCVPSGLNETSQAVSV